MRGRILWLLGCFLAVMTCNAQNDKRNEIGLRTGFGFSNEVLPERKKYKPVTILPYYNRYLSNKNRVMRVSIYAEPQITPVIIDYQHSAHSVMEYEAGINAGFILHCCVSRFDFYAGAGSGPNFITIKTRQQADGFLFSDNFFAGAQRVLGKGYKMDAHFRVRHISNAGIREPNKGIDNLLAVVGISKMIGKDSSVK